MERSSPFILVFLFLVAGYLFIIDYPLKDKNDFKLQKVINPTVTIQYEGVGGGSGTCIFKEQIDANTVELYFLTANHVVDFDMYNGAYSFISNLYRPIFNSDNDTYNDMPQLIVKGWLYDKDCRVEKTFENKAQIYKMWKKIDTAIVKVIAKPYDLITNIPVAKLETTNNFNNLKPGHSVICSGCPYLLPSIVSKGHIGRKNFNNKKELMGKLLNRVCLVRVNIAAGASGGGIYNYNNMRIIGIVSIGWGRNAFICGMIPITDIIPKLRKTYLGQRIGIGGNYGK